MTEIYVAELMIESNSTLETQTILSIFSNMSDLQVTNSDGASHTVSLQLNGLVAGITLSSFVCLTLKTFIKNPQFSGEKTVLY